MRKLLLAFLFACILGVNAQIGAAAEKIWVDEDFSLSALNRFYLNTHEMKYSKTAESPEVADIEKMFVEEGMEARRFVVPNADFERFLLRDQKVDLTALTPDEAKNVIKEKISNYADAYVEMTIVHNRRVVIFFEVYAAETGKMVFSYQGIAGSSDGDTIRTYGALTKDFFKALVKETKEQAKKKK